MRIFGSPYGCEDGLFRPLPGSPARRRPGKDVAAADLTTGKIAYKHINATVRDLSPIPLPLKMGSPPPVESSPRVAWLSSALRLTISFAPMMLTTGEKLWEDRLPAGGMSMVEITIFPKALARRHRHRRERNSQACR